MAIKKIMTKKQIEKHKIVAQKLEVITSKAFNLIKRNLNKISEYDVNKFILSEFRKEGLISDEKYQTQIVSTNENSAIVHYYPKKKKAKIIKENSLILIDIWAKLKEKNSPFADITWIAYSGKNIPKEINDIFKKVINARNFALKFIRESLKSKKFLKTKIVEEKVRNYFKKFNLEKYFPHGLGHSLGFSNCHGNYFRFSKKSKSKLKPNIPFTIEPGLYLKNKFGIRSEIDCYITENYKLIVTTKMQNKIVKII